MSSWRSASTGSVSATNSLMTGLPSLRRLPLEGCADIPFPALPSSNPGSFVLSYGHRDQLVAIMLQLGS